MTLPASDVSFRTATLTVAECAKELRISKDSLYQLIREGGFPPARRIGRRIVVPLVALERWLAEGETP